MMLKSGIKRIEEILGPLDEAAGKGKIGQGDHFWVVTVPTKDSVLIDIYFSTTLNGLMLQFRGGLKSSDIVGIYFDKNAAKKEALSLLAKRDKGMSLTINPRTGKHVWVSIPKD